MDKQKKQERQEKTKRFEEKANEFGKKTEKVGNKISQIGLYLTLGITFPLLLTLFLGPLGFVIGVGLVALLIAGGLNKDRDKDQNNE